MVSYLSVDLDFWCDKKDDKKSTKFFTDVLSLNLPMYVVESHEQLLDDINKHTYDNIYNVDYHSDLFGFHSRSEMIKWKKKNPYPDEGQWGVFIKWRRNGSFHWMYPKEDCYEKKSGCRGRGACWEEESDNPYLDTSYCDWKGVFKDVGIRKIRWDTIRAIGISASPDWIEIPSIKGILKALKIYDTENMIREFEPFTIKPKEISL